MGNPNVRSKKAPLGIDRSQTTSNDPETAKYLSIIREITELKVPIDNGDGENADEYRVGQVLKKMEGLSCSSQPAELQLRSYATAALNAKKTEQILRLVSDKKAFSALSSVPLSATTPAFVPALKEALKAQELEMRGGELSETSRGSINVEKLKLLLRGVAHHASNQFNTTSSTLTAPSKVSHNTPLSNSPSTTGNLTRLPPKLPKTFLARADKSKKDIIISSSSVVRNITEIVTRYLPSGIPYNTFTDEYMPEKYDLVKDLGKMSEKDRSQFWGRNWVEIEIDFRDGEHKVDLGNEKDISSDTKKENEQERMESIFDVLEKLGPEFPTCAKSLFVNIYTPTNNKSPVSLATQQNSSKYKIIEHLVTVLQSFRSVRCLEITLRTPASARNPLSMEQLNYILPFYDLAFTGWGISWQTGFMSRSERVRGWPLTYLDRERNRILWDREKMRREAVFVTESKAESFTLLEKQRGGGSQTVTPALAMTSRKPI